MTVELIEVRDDDRALRGALLLHELPEDQEQFAAVAKDTMPIGDADPGRTSVAIVAAGVPVGMFVLDSGGYLPELTTETDRTLLLRAFYVAPEHQGHGYAKAAVGATKAFVQQRFPHIDQVLLTVNGRNPGAIRTYLVVGSWTRGRTTSAVSAARSTSSG